MNAAEKREDDGSDSIRPAHFKTSKDMRRTTWLSRSRIDRRRRAGRERGCRGVEEAQDGCSAFSLTNGAHLLWMSGEEVVVASGVEGHGIVVNGAQASAGGRMVAASPGVGSPEGVGNIRSTV